MMILLYVAIVLKKPGPCRIILCYFLNIIVIPINFFACGGMNSGMPLYLLAALFLIIPTLSGKSRIITFIISLICDSIMIVISYFMLDSTPNLPHISTALLTKLTEKSQTIDVAFSLILTSAFVYFVTSSMMNAYQKERRSNQELVKRLEEYSLKDDLTKLYNRRFLFSHMENIDIFNKHFYIAMYDLDFFKKLNDSYGHLFGDRALKVISKKLMAGLDFDKKEIAARYGGEEFIVIFQADNNDDAYKRCDEVRKIISELTWDEMDHSITISGGIIHCSDFTDINPMLSRVDTLLYKAKNEGRNRIATDF